MEGKKRTHKTCAVAICDSPKTLDTIYHNFPKNTCVKQQWLVKCKPMKEINPNTASVCSKHFLPTDYERDLEHELLNLPPRKKLKKEAVPSQHLVSNNEETVNPKMVNTKFCITFQQ
jgi:hypothetical protein